MKSSHVTICLAKVKTKDEADFTTNVQQAIVSYYQQKENLYCFSVQGLHSRPKSGTLTVVQWTVWVA